ncbi:trehalose-6-phosphate synthase [Longimicrobium sp.]|uniref:alpha,alpha-trehalose-phosphate synthase (UDP-forming) n=1 Tax=Longimicrobium sp. TaxID=2029185 RepID=UPI002E378470|nr:trehalose-6-phosphate synthase [Longimicrobium sp.]HEX6037132.1 trehalose-6-phosphate synthase [Longimicrobium sp.]
MPIAPQELGPLFRRMFADRRFVVVSNREPYEHRWSAEVGETSVSRPAGGLTSALDPLMQALGGTWVAWGSGEADAAVVDPHHRVQVPPEDPRYTLRRVWLTHHDIHRYYLGFSNQFLWPLCHLRPDLTRVRTRYWERYRRVNRRFSDAVLEEAQGKQAAVWIQDYHLALAPALIRARRPDLTLSHFWHIPFPPFDIFRLAPQAEALLRGLLANDLMGFHLPMHADNFLRCARRIAGAEVDWQARTATLDGHTCHVGAFPISIDVDQFREAATVPDAEEQMARIRQRYAPRGGMIGVGVDRLDYSKGLPEKFKALEMLWERYPEFRERFTFIQVAVPSRSDIEAYDDLAQKVDRQVWEINDRFGTGDWRPIHLLKQSLPVERLAILYRLADVCIIGSLQDGMNLVAKEYVASQVDRNGALLLSEFAGAAEEMADAVLINPYDPEGCALRIRDALTLPASDRAAAMERLQGSLTTIYDWLNDVFTAWGGVARDGASAAPVSPRATAVEPDDELFADLYADAAESEEE